jgi:hypothetical protein
LKVSYRQNLVHSAAGDGVGVGCGDAARLLVANGSRKPVSFFSVKSEWLFEFRNESLSLITHHSVSTRCVACIRDCGDDHDQRDGPRAAAPESAAPVPAQRVPRNARRSRPERDGGGEAKSKNEFFFGPKK